MRYGFLLVGAVACAPAQPFSGPGYDDGELLIDHDGPLLAVVTHAKVARGEMKGFNEHVDRIGTQLETQPGFVGSSLRAEVFGRDRWTLTVWVDEEHLTEFVVSDTHLDAMAETTSLTEEVRSAAWTLSADELPPRWGDALDELDGE